MAGLLRRATGENYCNNLSSPASILRRRDLRLILLSWILLSFILKLGETFSISEFKLNSEVRAATKNHLSIHFE